MNSLQRTIRIGAGLARKEILGAPPVPACNLPLFRLSKPPSPLIIPSRLQTGYSYKGGSYYGSKVVDDKNLDLFTLCEKSYEEWKYVEKLFPLVYVPEAPSDPDIKLPSGWQPPRQTRENCSLPYFIPRTKNHMIPVYLYIHKRYENRGLQRRTRIKNVEGNIWALEKDLAAYLRDEYPKKVIVTWVNENWRQAFVRSDYVDAVKEWVLDQGF